MAVPSSKFLAVVHIRFALAVVVDVFVVKFIEVLLVPANAAHHGRHQDHAAASNHRADQDKRQNSELIQRLVGVCSRRGGL